MNDSRLEKHANPYVGPRPLQVGEPLFGRDRELRELSGLVTAARIVMLHSPSGAGKTSLIQAGLVPEMQQERFQVLPLIRLNQVAGRTNGHEANRYVLSAILSLEAGLASADQRGADDIATMTLATYLAQRPRSPEMPDSELLVFDQFEEILTLDPTDRAAKADFFAQVGEALRDEDRWALFALREDHLGGIDPYASLVPTRFATSYRVDLLNQQAAVVAMRHPAAGAGVEFTDDAAQRLVDDLCRVRVQRPDGSTVEVPGGTIEPVQLQVVCHRLWDRLPPDADRIDAELVGQIGSVSDTLRAFYADAVALTAAASNTPEQDIRAWIGERLIMKNGLRGQVLREPGGGTGLPDQAISLLRDNYLVRAESRRGTTWLELAHDRLIEPILADNNAWFQSNLSTLQQQARLWHAQGRPSGYLITGEALSQAERWAESSPDTLSAVDREFLDASRTQRTAHSAERLQRELETERRLALEAGHRAAEAAAQIVVSRRRLAAVALGALAAGAALGAAIASR